MHFRKFKNFTFHYQDAAQVDRWLDFSSDHNNDAPSCTGRNFLTINWLGPWESRWAEEPGPPRPSLILSERKPATSYHWHGGHLCSYPFGWGHIPHLLQIHETARDERRLRVTNVEGVRQDLLPADDRTTRDHSLSLSSPSSEPPWHSCAYIERGLTSGKPAVKTMIFCPPSSS